MLAEMSSVYDELKDHDAPPTRVMGGGGVGGVASKSEIEMSLNLDDLEDMRGSLHRRSSHRRGPGNGGLGGSIDNSNLSLSSWAHEPEATTGNLMMLGGSSLAGYWRASSLSSVYEQDQNDNSSDDGYRPTNSGDGDCRVRRPRRNSADNDESFLPSIGESEESSNSNFTRSQSWDGCLLSGSLSELDLGANERAGKRVHFEVPARLEDIQEYDKPDFADYNRIWYMGHEIQKMMDDFKKETELNRHVVR